MCFYGEVLLAPRPTPKLEDHSSSAVRGCLFNLFTASLHIGGRSNIGNVRTRHAVVTGTHIYFFKINFSKGNGTLPDMSRVFQDVMPWHLLIINRL